MNLKKLFSSAAVSTLAIAGIASASNFSDTQGSWVETGGYLDTAIEEGVIDGSKSTFRPNDTINRAELTKMVTVYDNGGDVPTSLDYLSEAGFSDVPSDAWFFNVVNYAAEEGIVSGYSDGTFKPANEMNRAEAVKVITLALEVPSVDVTLPFSDVAETDWFYPYVKNAYGNCIVKGKTSSKFKPADAITRAEAVKVFVESINPGCTDTVNPGTSTPTPTNDGYTQTPEASTPTPTVDPNNPTTPTPVVTTDAKVEVVLSANSPASRSVPKNAYQVPFLAIDVTASNDEDLLLTGLEIQHSGLGTADNIKNVQVFEGVIPRGNDKDISGENDTATLNLQSDPVIIPKGTTKTVFIRADLDSEYETAGEHSLAILDANSITLVGKDTGGVVSNPTGAFPIVGATMSVADINVGDIAVTRKTIADNIVENGTKDVELGAFEVKAGSAEDVYVRTLTVEIEGGLDDGDIENLYVEVDNTRVSDVVAYSANDYVTFNLTSVNSDGVLIEDGSSEDFYIKGDLTGPIDSFSKDPENPNNAGIVVTIDTTSDIVVVGAKYGFGVERTLNGDVTSTPADAYKNSYGLVVAGGDVTFSIDSESADVADDTDGIIFGTLKIENDAEAIEIDGDTYSLYLKVNDDRAEDDLENIRLVDKASGATILGTVDISDDGNDTNNPIELTNFSEDLYLKAGETKEYYIVADTRDNLTEGDTYQFVFSEDGKDISSDTGSISNITVKGQVSDTTSGFDVKPSASISTKVFTLKESGITVTKKTLQSDTYVAGTTNAVLWNGVIKAKNVKNIRVDRLKFDNDVDDTIITPDVKADTSDINGFSIQKKDGDNWVDLEAGVSSNVPVTFSDLDLAGNFDINKGDEVEIRVVAEISDEVTNDAKIELALVETRVKEIEANGSIGDTLSETNYPVADYEATTFTLIDSGSVNVTLDNADTPNNELLIAGTDDNTVAVYKFKADDEDVKVEDLTVEVVDNGKIFDGSSEVNSTASVSETVSASTVHKNDRVTIALDSTETGTGSKFRVRFTSTQSDDTFTTSSYVYEVTGTETGGISGIATDFANTINADTHLTATASGNVITVERTASDTNTTNELNLDNSDLGSPVTISNLAYSTNGGTTWKNSVATVDDALADGNTDTGETSTITIGGTVASTDVFTVVISDAITNGTATAMGVAGDATATASAIADAINDAGPTISNGNLSASASGGIVTLTAVETDSTDRNLASFNVSVSISGTTGPLPIPNDKDSVKSVSLYNGTTKLDEVTLNTDGKAIFDDLGWVIPAGDTEQLTVKVDLNNIGTDSSDSAESGHTFTTKLYLDEIKGNDSGDTLTVTDPSNSSSYFIVSNNKLQVSKLSSSTSLSGGNADLLKFKLFDASSDGDRAEVTTLEFDVTGTGASMDLAAGTYELVGGSNTITCDKSSLTATSGTVECNLTNEEISASGTTFTLKTTAIGVSVDNTVTTKLVINSTAPGGSEGVTWTDGGNGSASSANGVSINWIDFGEADESTTYILNTVEN